MRCPLTIKGHVQDVGYRDIIEKSARRRGLHGYVFNDIDGTVKLVCDSAAESIDEFIDVINLHEGGIFVENILKREIETSFPIPGTFSRIKTDTKEDTERKLDKGVDAIKSVKADTILLVRGQNKLVEGQERGFKDLNEGQNKLVEGQERGAISKSSDFIFCNICII